MFLSFVQTAQNWESVNNKTLKQNIESFIIFENGIVNNEKMLHCALLRADYYYVLPDDDPL